MNVNELKKELADIAVELGDRFTSHHQNSCHTIITALEWVKSKHGPHLNNLEGHFLKDHSDQLTFLCTDENHNKLTVCIAGPNQYFCTMQIPNETRTQTVSNPRYPLFAFAQRAQNSCENTRKAWFGSASI